MTLVQHTMQTFGHIAVTEYHIYDARDDCIIVSGTSSEMEELLDTMAGNLFIFTTEEIEQFRTYKETK